MKTQHSQIRQQQRGISDQMLDLIMEFGLTQPAQGGAIIIELPRNFLQVVEKAMQKRAIMSEDGGILSVESIIRGIKRRQKG